MNHDAIPLHIRESLHVDPRQSLAAHHSTAPKGVSIENIRETASYRVSYSVIDGIERIRYEPRQRRFQTPLLFQHGMWHGAWCWEEWQALFAEWGWQSIATSLPGHAASFQQRPIEFCTLDYYLGFVRDEVQHLPTLPVLIGHSMGGALAQWYLKYVSDALPGVVFVASWSSHDAMADSFPRFEHLVPEAVKESLQSGLATPLINTPERAAKVLLSSTARWSAEALHAKLGPESGLVTFQHSPPFWEPPQHIRTPLLWLTAEQDALLSVTTAQQSAAFYGAEYVLLEGAAHNVMMEQDFQATAQIIHDWLIAQDIK